MIFILSSSLSFFFSIARNAQCCATFAPPRHHRTGVTTHRLFPTDNTLTHATLSPPAVFLPCCEFSSTIFNHLPCAYHTPPPRPAALPLCNAYLSYPQLRTTIFFAPLPPLRSRVRLLSVPLRKRTKIGRKDVYDKRGPNLSETLYSNEIIRL